MICSDTIKDRISAKTLKRIRERKKRKEDETNVHLMIHSSSYSHLLI